MACDIKRDEDGEVIAIACGSSWGIGVYYYGGEPIYGFPPRGCFASDFTPDRESCTKAEIAAWEQALAVERGEHLRLAPPATEKDG